MDLNLNPLFSQDLFQKNEQTSSTNQLLTLEKREPSEFEFDEDLKNDLIIFYEAFHFLEKRIVTKEQVCTRFEISQAELKFYYEDYLREALYNRGIKLPPFSPVRKKRPLSTLDPLFATAVSIICDTADKRSTAAKLKTLGLTTKQWQAHLRIPEHQVYFQQRLKIAFEGTDSVAQLSLAKNVESGDLQSIKYFNELTGKYRPQEETTMNFVFLLTKLMEILSKRLEPQLLAEIADEIDTVLELPQSSIQEGS